MLQIIGTYGFLNSEIKSADWLRRNMLLKTTAFYEVIRIIDSSPLFFTEHMKRMERSCGFMGISFDWQKAKIFDLIRELIISCSIFDGNIKISYGRTDSTEKHNLLTTFIPHYYPSQFQKRNGVKTTLFPSERSLPNIKRSQQRSLSLEKLIDRQSGFYEALMVNSNGKITEGSRSNVFFIKDETIVTSPEPEVLQGITRAKVLEIIKSKDWDLKRELVDAENVSSYEAVFITGTSPGVLGVRSIDNVEYDVENPIMREIEKSYEEVVQKYLNDVNH